MLHPLGRAVISAGRQTGVVACLLVISDFLVAHVPIHGWHQTRFDRGRGRAIHVARIPITT